MRGEKQTFTNVTISDLERSNDITIGVISAISIGDGIQVIGRSIGPGVSWVVIDKWIIETYTDRIRHHSVEIQDAPEQAGKPLSISTVTKPWENIKDHSSDRLIIELWCSGWTNSQIGKTIHVQPRVVTNYISRLRLKYPEGKNTNRR